MNWEVDMGTWAKIGDAADEGLRCVTQGIGNAMAESKRRLRRQIWEDIREEIEVYETFVRDPYTMVIVARGSVFGTGFAKRNPKDKPNEAAGLQIAKGRAIADLLDQLVECR